MTFLVTEFVHPPETNRKQKDVTRIAVGFSYTGLSLQRTALRRVSRSQYGRVRPRPGKRVKYASDNRPKPTPEGAKLPTVPDLLAYIGSIPEIFRVQPYLEGPDSHSGREKGASRRGAGPAGKAGQNLLLQAD
jgi:hypothetical protein